MSKKCLSYSKRTDERCKNNTIKNCDFCAKHIQKHTYYAMHRDVIQLTDADNYVFDLYIDLMLNEIDEMHDKAISVLDNEYNHGLFYMFDTWRDVSFVYWGKYNNMWYDMRMLIDIFNAQLNRSEMNNPYPIFPECPYTRIKFSINDLNLISAKIKLLEKHKLLSNKYPLKKFLECKCLDKIYDTHDKYASATKIVSLFSTSMRFKPLNSLDSQNNMNGEWVPKNKPLSDFEMNTIEINNLLNLMGDNNISVSVFHIY